MILIKGEKLPIQDKSVDTVLIMLTLSSGAGNVVGHGYCREFLAQGFQETWTHHKVSTTSIQGVPSPCLDVRTTVKEGKSLTTLWN